MALNYTEVLIFSFYHCCNGHIDMLDNNQFFCFFQAEDGIRDGHVTGVQTCALPICRYVSPSQRPRTARDAGRGGTPSGSAIVRTAAPGTALVMMRLPRTSARWTPVAGGSAVRASSPLPNASFATSASRRDGTDTYVIVNAPSCSSSGLPSTATVASASIRPDRRSGLPF